MAKRVKKLLAVWASSTMVAVAFGGGEGALQLIAQAVEAVAGAQEPAPVAAPPKPPGIAPSEVLLANLTDGRRAVDVLPVHAYLTPVVLPLSAIDLTVDRRLLLQQLFARVTGGAADPIQEWVEYLQERVAHPNTPPMHGNGIEIHDPLWILENRLAWCSQVNRVLVDGLLAAGYKARVVQLRNHQAAEVWLDGDWRFLDADWLNATVREPDGSLPSALEIHEDPSLLAGLTWNPEYPAHMANLKRVDPSFYAEVFLDEPYYYVKTATPSQERDEYFGWRLHFKTENRPSS